MLLVNPYVDQKADGRREPPHNCNASCMRSCNAQLSSTPAAAAATHMPPAPLRPPAACLQGAVVTHKSEERTSNPAVVKLNTCSEASAHMLGLQHFKAYLTISLVLMKHVQMLHLLLRCATLRTTSATLLISRMTRKGTAKLDSRAALL